LILPWQVIEVLLCRCICHLNSSFLLDVNQMLFLLTAFDETSCISWS
jgi:hypothetical protein